MIPQKNKKQMVTRSIRFNQKSLKKAEALGIDISQVCRDTLEASIKIVEKEKAKK